MNLAAAIEARLSPAPPAHAATRSSTPTRVLEAHGVTLGYAGAAAVLEDFSLYLAEGEILALLGPSGVGKSSLLRVLAGLQAPLAGQVHIHGRELDGPDPRLGFVLQDPCLLPWLNLEENVAFGLDFRHQPRLSLETRRQRVQQAIDEVGLTAARHRFPSELSGGMAQRTALARSLARAPEILLLDEPFAALDEITRVQMQALLLDVTARHRAAAILVTHDIDEALLLADRIVLIGGQPGRIIGQWQPQPAQPRDITDPQLTAQRVQILQALRSAFPSSSSPAKDHAA